MLYQCKRYEQITALRSHEEINNLSRHPQKHCNSKCFNPGITSKHPLPYGREDYQYHCITYRHGVDQHIRKIHVIQQVVIPQTIIQIRNKVPCKHKKHTPEEFGISQGKCKYFLYLHVHIIKNRIFFCLRLQEYFKQHQRKTKIPKYWDLTFRPLQYP